MITESEIPEKDITKNAMVTTTQIRKNLDSFATVLAKAISRDVSFIVRDLVDRRRRDFEEQLLMKKGYKRIKMTRNVYVKIPSYDTDEEYDEPQDVVEDAGYYSDAPDDDEIVIGDEDGNVYSDEERQEDIESDKEEDEIIEEVIDGNDMDDGELSIDVRKEEVDEEDMIEQRVQGKLPKDF